jgi:hypothetical protein
MPSADTNAEVPPDGREHPVQVPGGYRCCRLALGTGQPRDDDVIAAELVKDVRVGVACLATERSCSRSSM